jgi:hypothetical protein
MTDLKLGKLPYGTPVQLSITITLGLQAGLQAYAVSYASTYGVEEPIAALPRRDSAPSRR